MALIGERLRTIRERNAMTQEDLASSAGISVRLLQKYEAGESDPSLDNASKLADLLGTTTDYLAGRTNVSLPNAEGDLSLIERFIIMLFRNRRMPTHIEAALNEMMSNELQQPTPPKKQARQNQ